MAPTHRAGIATVFHTELQPQGPAGHTSKSTVVQNMDLLHSAERQAPRDKEGSFCSKKALRKQRYKPKQQNDN